MRTHPTRIAFLAGGLVLLVANAPALGEVLSFTATLGGSQEVPANDRRGTGTVVASFDTETNTLTWTVEYSDLTGEPTAAHFHGPAAGDATAPPVVPIEGSLAAPIHGSATLTPQQLADLNASLWYFNIHTAQFPDGEIRGQVTGPAAAIPPLSGGGPKAPSGPSILGGAGGQGGQAGAGPGGGAGGAGGAGIGGGVGGAGGAGGAGIP